MLEKKIITRFAPSPTGYMHIGNIRTAFFCWLFAKKNNGSFFLRIDDTDKNRNSKKYVNNIFDTLNWLNIDYDYVFFQTDRFFVYKKYLLKLISNGYAYKCYCSKERLDHLRYEQLRLKKKIAYDGFCKNLKESNNNNDFIVRFNNFISCDSVVFNDLFKGRIQISNLELDDFIISKFYIPTYNFASVVDDIENNVTHIIRGEDHISNTQKQILLFKAFCNFIPLFGHLPMILGPDREKISKRNSSFYIDYYRKNGIISEAFLNYIFRLGLGFKNQEIFSLHDMLNHFDLKNISKSSCSINDDKLYWFNKLYIRKAKFNNIRLNLIVILKKFDINFQLGPNIVDLIKFSIHRIKSLDEIIKLNLFYYDRKTFIFVYYFFYDLLFLFYFDLKKTRYKWKMNIIKNYFHFFMCENVILLRNFFNLLRFVITGSLSTLPLYEIFFLSGKILILKKIINIINKKGL